MINLEPPPNPDRPLSLLETEAVGLPLVGAAPEVMMKYIESLDGPGEGIFQNNRIAQLKPNCPPFVTVCPGCNSPAAHLLTEDTTGRLFSQLVTTIGPSCKKTFGKNGFFPRPRLRLRDRLWPLFPGTRPTAPFWPDTSKTGDAASRPTIGWSLQSKSKDWRKARRRCWNEVVVAPPRGL